MRGEKILELQSVDLAVPTEYIYSLLNHGV